MGDPLRPGDGGLAGAPVALDVDGVAVVTVGTAVWGILLVVAVAMHRSLRQHGHLWWIATAACGFGLGLLGIAYCLRRRRAATG